MSPEQRLLRTEIQNHHPISCEATHCLFSEVVQGWKPPFRDVPGHAQSHCPAGSRSLKASFGDCPHLLYPVSSSLLKTGKFNEVKIDRREPCFPGPRHIGTHFGPAVGIRGSAWRYKPLADGTDPKLLWVSELTNRSWAGRVHWKGFKGASCSSSQYERLLLEF